MLLTFSPTPTLEDLSGKDWGTDCDASFDRRFDSEIDRIDRSRIGSDGRWKLDGRNGRKGFSCCASAVEMKDSMMMAGDGSVRRQFWRIMQLE